MQVRQQKLIESYQRVQVFLESNPAPGTAGITEARAMLDAALVELKDHSTAQLFGRQLSRAERQRVIARMKRLRNQHMRPIVAIAKAQAGRMPGIRDELQMPAGGLGSGNLLAAAGAMRNAAANHVPIFVEAGLPADFLDRFDAAMGAIRQALGGHAVNIGTKVGANEGLKAQLQRARQAVDILDPLVQTAFEGNDVVLARWRAAKRVKAVPTFPASADGQEPAPDVGPEPQPTAA
jgi:hypothetical protein